MHRADPRAGEHRRRRLGDHRHVDHDAVASRDALALEQVREPPDEVVQLAIGQRAAVAGLVALEDDRDLVAALAKVAVEAVGGEVERAVGEPFDVEVGLVERPVAGHGRRLDPVEPPRLLEPEGVHVVRRRLAQRRQLRRANSRGKVGRDGVGVAHAGWSISITKR